MNKKRKREKKQRLAEAVRRWRESEGNPAKSKPTKASSFLYHINEYHKEHPDIQVILYCRVSTWAQKCRENFDIQERVLRRKFKKCNIPIVDCYHEVSSGWVLDSEERWALVEATKEARKHIEKGRKTVIVATSSDRFLRNRYFTTKEPYLLPTEAEFEKLKELTRRVSLLTLLHPDMHPRKVRSRQTKWGQKVKRNSGGRPILKRPGYKKMRRGKKLPTVRRLLKKGKNPTEIAKKVRVARSTVSDWIGKYI